MRAYILPNGALGIIELVNIPFMPGQIFRIQEPAPTLVATMSPLIFRDVLALVVSELARQVEV